MDKTIYPLNARIREKYELVTLFVRKVGDLNRRTGEFTFWQRSRESTDLNTHGGFGSGDDGRYEIKNSLSDSIIEIGSSTHTLKTVKSKNNFLFSLQRDCHENDNKPCKQKGVTVCPSPLTSLIKDIPSAEKDENPTTVDVIKKVADDEARAARLKQIKDFFTDPVDREIFPLSETKKPPSRPIIPREIPSIEESVTKMIEQFRTAMRNEENVLEAHSHRYGVSAPPLGQVHTQSQRKINYQKNNEENRPANQAKNGYLIANDEKMRESESCSSVHEKVAHRTPWYVKLCCCGTITNPKKVKLENRQKSSNELKTHWK